MQLSKFNSQLTLDYLCKKPEGQYLERKGRDQKPGKIANELIGMLNAGGGVLVYGISDDGQAEDLAVVGGLLANEPTHLDAYRKLVHDFILPPANIELEEVYLKTGELIFIYHVDQDYERLFQRKDNETVYFRVADSNRGPLSRGEVKKLEYNKAIRSFEEELRPDFELADFDQATCEVYRVSMNYKGNFDELAEKRRLAIRKNGHLVYKNAAILLFAKDPEKYIANANVRYVRYAGVELKPGERFNVVKDERFEMNIPKLVQHLETFIAASLRDYYYLDLNQGKFLKVPEFPKDAWLEGIVNALCHRSYNITGNPIMIRHFDDRIEISNSGPLPAQVTVENIASERYSRNPRIARVLADMGYVRELNEGVPRIYRVMKEFAHAKPEYLDQSSIVTLTLRNKITEHKETILSQTLERIELHWNTLNSSQHRMIALLFESQEATIQQMIQHIGVTEQSIRYNLKKLEKLDILERVSEKLRDSHAIYRFKNG